MMRSLTICVLFASLLSQQLFASVASIRLEDKKTYYSPPDPNTGSPPDPNTGSPPSGTPPSQGGYTPTPSTPSTTPPSNNCGSPPYDPSLSPPSHTPSRPSTPSHTPTPSRPSHTPTPSRPSHTPTPSHTPHTPPPCNCGSPPYDPTPSTPTPSTPFTPTPSTPSTPSNPPSGGYYSSPPPSTPIVDTPPTPIIGESPPTPILDPGTPIIGGSPPTPYLDPGTPGTPFVPAPFPPSTGTCDYWRNHPTLIWGLVGWWGTVGGAFGTLSTPSSIPGFDPHMNLLQALSNSRTDAIGALYREGTASWLNSMANNRFPFTTPQVRDHFLAGLSSTKAATKQAHTFKLANEGRLKPRI